MEEVQEMDLMKDGCLNCFHSQKMDRPAVFLFCQFSVSVKYDFLSSLFFLYILSSHFSALLPNKAFCIYVLHVYEDRCNNLFNLFVLTSQCLYQNLFIDNFCLLLHLFWHITTSLTLMQSTLLILLYN